MKRGSKTRTLVITIVFSAPVLFAHAALACDKMPVTFSSEELLDKIVVGEKLIHDVQAHIKWYEPDSNNLLLVGDWGYERPKVFIEGDLWAGENKDKAAAHIKYAFDGEIQRNFRHNTGESWTTAGIYALTPETFTVYMTPNTLMGHSVKQHTIETLGEILSRARTVKVKKRGEQIDGHSCCILEAIGIQDADHFYDIRAWIDTQRDFRPLRIRKFYSPEDKHHPIKKFDSPEDKHRADPNERWRAVCEVVDNIRLRQIDGVWFPIQGERQTYRQEWLPPKGMTKKEFKKAYAHLPEAEQYKKARYVTTARTPKHRIDIDSIRINKGTEPEKFTVEFPEGCRVWDDFLKVGYDFKSNRTKKEWDEILEEGRKQSEQQKFKEVLIGKAAPSFPKNATWLNSKPLTWKDLEGKVVILHFWARWCGPCHNDLPVMSGLHKNRKDSGIVVIGIHTPSNKIEDVRKVIKEYQLGYPICIDTAKAPGGTGFGVMSNKFYVSGIPYAFVTDEQGCVAGHGWRTSDVLRRARDLVKK